MALAFCSACIVLALGLYLSRSMQDDQLQERALMLALGAAALTLCVGAVFAGVLKGATRGAESEDRNKSLTEQVGLLEHIIDHVPHAVFWKDREGQFLGGNQLFAEKLGFKNPSELIGKSDADLAATEEERAAYRKDDMEVMELKLPKINIEETQHFSDGSVATLLTSKVPLIDDQNEVVGVLGIFTDITERKQMQEQLERNAEHLRQIIDLVPHKIFAKDAEGRFILANAATAKVHGLTVDELVGKTHEELHGDGDEIARMRSDDNVVLETQQPLRISEEVFTTAEGKKTILETTKIPITDPATGRPAVLGVAVDLTDRKMMESQLRKSEERFRVLCDAAPVGIFQMDVEGYCLYTNPKWQDIAGLTLQQSLGEGWGRVVHPDDYEGVIATRNEAMHSRKSYEQRFRFVSPDGEVRWVHSMVSAVREASGQVVGYVGTIEQIEEPVQ